MSGPWEAYAAPEAAPAGPWDAYKAPAMPAIDLTDPIKRLPEIRAEIAKLKGPERDTAMRQLADAYVAAEREASPNTTGADNVARTLSRGSFVGPFLDEINAAGSHVANLVSGGRIGAPYDETVAYERARDRDVDTRYPVLSTVGKIAGGVSGGVGAMNMLRAGPNALGSGLAVAAGGPLAAVAPAATTLGRMGQGAGIGGAYGAAAGAGDAEGGIDTRLEGAARGVIPGAIVGGVLPAAVDAVRGTTRAVSNMIDPSRSAYERVASTLGDETIDQFSRRIVGPANFGSIRSAPGDTQRVMRILGEEMQAARGNVARAEAATLARMQNELRLTPQEATEQLRRVGQMNADSPLMFGEQPMVAGRPATAPTTGTLTRPAEAATPSTGEMGVRNTAGRAPTADEIKAIGTVEEHPLGTTFDYLATTGGTAAANTRNAIVRRQNDQGTDFVERLRRLLPNGDTPETAANLLDGMRTMARREYETAYTRPVNLGLMQRNTERILERHAARAGGRAGDQAEAIQRAMREFRLQDGRPLQTLQQMQDARQAVRGMISAADRTGDTHIVASMQPLYRDITTVMERVSPAWARANRRWADGAATERGWDLGASLMGKASPGQREQLIEFRRMAPEAQRLARIGFIQKLEDMVTSAKDGADFSRLFRDDGMRALVREVLGGPTAMQLERAVRNQNVMARSARAGGGSQTQPRQVMRERMEGDPAIMAAVTSGSTTGIRTALMNAARHLLSERRNRVLSDIVTTPMSDTPRVAQHIQRMRTEQQRLERYNAPRPGTAAIGATAAARVGSLTAPTTGDGSHHSHYQPRDNGRFSTEPQRNMLRP